MSTSAILRDELHKVNVALFGVLAMLWAVRAAIDSDDGTPEAASLTLALVDRTRAAVLEAQAVVQRHP